MWGQQELYIQRNDSIIKHICDSVARTKPTNEQNAYRIAIEQLFATYWKSRTKVILPFEKVNKKKEEIDSLQAQINSFTKDFDASKASINRCDSLISVQINLIDSLEVLLERVKTISVDSSSLKQNAADTMKLYSEIVLMQQMIDERKQENEKIEAANKSMISLIERKQNNLGMRLLFFSDEVDSAYKESARSLATIDTMLLQKVIKEYRSYGIGMFADSTSINSKMERIFFVEGTSTFLQRCIKYMAEMNYEKTESEKMINEIRHKEKSKSLSSNQKKECADIRKALDYQEVAYLNLQYIIDEIWKKYPNGFLSYEKLRDAQVIRRMIDPEVKLATDGQLVYDIHYVKMNEALEYLRTLFSPDKYPQNQSALSSRSGMTEKKLDIQTRYGL